METIPVEKTKLIIDDKEHILEDLPESTLAGFLRVVSPIILDKINNLYRQPSERKSVIIEMLKLNIANGYLKTDEEMLTHDSNSILYDEVDPKMLDINSAGISIDRATNQVELTGESMKALTDELLGHPSFVQYVSSKLKTTHLPQQSSWQNMDSLSLQSMYTIDNKEINAKLLFSVRGGYPRITVFTDTNNVTRDTIINAKFNYKRIDQLFTLMELYTDTEKNGKLFTYTTNNVEYTKDNKPTNNIIEEAKVTLSINEGVYILTVTNGKLPVISFPITNQYEVYGDITNEINQKLNDSTDSTIAFKSLVARLKYIFRSLEVIHIRETQSKPLNKRINHIG